MVNIEVYLLVYLSVTYQIHINIQVHSRIKHILREINLAISDKAGCFSDLLTEWKII